MTAPLPTKAELGAAFQRMQDESGGALMMEVIGLGDVLEMLAHAMAGDSNAIRTARLVNQAVRRIQDAPRGKPMLCGSCPRPLRQGRFHIAVAYPAVDVPGEGMAMAICLRCASTREEAMQKATVALRRVWPDLTPIRVTHPKGGRA